jgi:electron transport complex protein RnfG
MNDILKVTINLVLICAAAGVILSATWTFTEPVKVARENEERDLALKGLIPAATSIVPVKEVTIAGKEGIVYKALSGDKTEGYIVLSYGKGYSSFIKLLVAVDAEMKVTGIDVLGHAETPGLGDQIETALFKGQFKGKGIDNLVVVKGETQTDIQAISGATISSRAVTKGVKEALEILKKEMETGGI